ncbi:MAG TPA: hypothetical protein VJ208_00725 [Candidatus Nanoarchaeia archaeon]|nr:hypothetical protein [Candidatus Nanoarchaeia archaeon]
MGEWNKSKAKGNISESIIEMLINSMPDWKCIKFGVENHIEELRKIVRENFIETKKIKSMPDFIAFNKETGKMLFIEVKYRGFIDKKIPGKSIYNFHYKRLDEYLEYWKETKLIFVHPYPPYFFVVDLKDVEISMCQREQTGINEWTDYWDFGSIEKRIEDLFPDLKDDVLEDAVKLIPFKE